MLQENSLKEKIDIAIEKGFTNAIHLSRSLDVLEKSNLKKINYSEYLEKWREIFSTLLYVLQGDPLITAVKKAKILENEYQ